MQVHTGRRRATESRTNQSRVGGGLGGLGGGRFQMKGEERQQTAADPYRKGTGPDFPATANKKQKKLSTAVQRGRGDARRGVRPQTGGAEAERIATAGVRSAAELGQYANLKHERHGNRYVSMVV